MWSATLGSCGFAAQQYVESAAEGPWYWLWKALPNLTRRYREVHSDLKIYVVLRSGPTPVSRSGRQRLHATGRRLASVIIMCSAYLDSTHAVRLLVTCFGLIFGTALGMTGGGKINLPTLPECEPREQLRQILVLQTQLTMGRLRVHSCTIINSIIVNSVTLHGGEVGVSACHSRGSRCLSTSRVQVRGGLWLHPMQSWASAGNAGKTAGGKYAESVPSPQLLCNWWLSWPGLILV